MPHATALLIAELFEKHDRERFSIVGYSYGPDDGSTMRRRLVKAFDRFVDVRNASFQEAAERIAADEVDMLVDLKGYTADTRTQILAYRPAPIQVNYLGYPGTMGAPFFDYILVDDFIVPPDQQPFFDERLVHLPGCYQVNDSRREISPQHAVARRLRAAGGWVRLLLVQQQLQDHARSVRRLDASAAGGARQRVVAAGRPSAGQRQPATRGTSARHRARAAGVRPASRLGRPSGAPPPGRAVPRHVSGRRAYDRQRCPVGGLPAGDDRRRHVRLAGGRQPAARLGPERADHDQLAAVRSAGPAAGHRPRATGRAALAAARQPGDVVAVRRRQICQ